MSIRGNGINRISGAIWGVWCGDGDAVKVAISNEFVCEGFLSKRDGNIAMLVTLALELDPQEVAYLVVECDRDFGTEEVSELLFDGWGLGLVAKLSFSQILDAFFGKNCL